MTQSRAGTSEELLLFAIAKSALKLVESSESQFDFLKGLSEILISKMHLNGVRIALKNRVDLAFIESRRMPKEPSHSYVVVPVHSIKETCEQIVFPDEIEKFIDGRQISTYSSRLDSMGKLHLEMVDFKICLPLPNCKEVQGLLVLFSSPKFLMGFQRAFMNDLAFIIGATVCQRMSKIALNERIKEQSCLYEIAQINRKTDLTLSEKMRAIASMLPLALQFPNLASARIEFEGSTFVSENFKSSPNYMAAQIEVGQDILGTVCIYYCRPSENKQSSQNGAPVFLHEERQLIEGVACEIGNLLERNRAEKEKKELFQQLRHADRLAIVGQLASGVAHEMNEPLSSILGFSQLIQQQKGLNDTSKKDLSNIVNAVLYSNEIIKKLMIFSLQTKSKTVLFDLSNIIENTLEILGLRCIRGGVSVFKSFDSRGSLIYGDPSEMQQVFMNLIVNAISSMKQGGELKVSTQQKDSFVEIVLEDTGEGISEKVLPNIFDPFFTTKGVGEGTGLGLTVVHGIIKSHGGRIKASSQLNIGTRFEIQLPIKG